MILLIDNYDSFVYNLYHLIGQFRTDIQVVRNRDLTLEQVRALNPEAVFLSPGPGRPEDAGICMELARDLHKPIFGVCLGHQAICRAYGGTVGYAKELMHGKSSLVYPVEDSRLFQGIQGPIRAARYHSLAAPEEDLPPCLRVAARTQDGEVMAVEHVEKPIFGVQFHPESVLTQDGKAVLQNFFKQIGANNHD